MKKDKKGLGGVLLGATVGGYAGYKIGRAKPQKKGFETEKKIAEKVSKKFKEKKKPAKSMAKGGSITERKEEYFSDLGDKLDIDINYMVQDWEDVNSFDELEEAISENQGFDREVIYYATAMEYLTEYDTSLQESLGIASDMGFECGNLNSETLASLLQSQNVRNDFYENQGEIDEFFEQLKDEDEDYAKGGGVKKPRLKKGDNIYIDANKWQDMYGNTYHIVQVYVNDDYLGESDYTYGYGDHYEQTAKKMIFDKYAPPYAYKDEYLRNPIYMLKEKGINVKSRGEYVNRKKDMRRFAKGGSVVNLEPSNRKSFYGKAKAITKGGKTYLQSYDTIVAEYNPKSKKMKIYDWYSPTTARHINAFLDYFGYPNMSKGEILENKNKHFAKGGSVGGFFEGELSFLNF